MMGEYLILGCLIVGITYRCLLSVGGDKPSSLPALHSHSQRKGSFPLMIRCSYVSSLLPTLSKHSPFSSTRVPNRLSRRTLPLSWCTGKVSLATLPALCNFGSFWGTSYFSSNLNNWSSGSLDSSPNAKAFRGSFSQRLYTRMLRFQSSDLWLLCHFLPHPASAGPLNSQVHSVLSGRIGPPTLTWGRMFCGNQGIFIP